MKKNFLLLLKLYVLLVIATSNLMAQVQGHKQSKHASSVIQDNIKDNFLKTKESTSTLYHTHYYLLATFGQPPSANQANQIKKYGIEILQYISDNTYWAKIPSYISTEAISQVGIVALRKFEPKEKIESNLFDEKNQNALVVNIIVAPFIPKEEIDKQLSFLGISSFNYYEGLNTIKASLTFSQILKVANLPYTLWVEKEEVEASTLGNIVREHYRVDPLENVYGLTGKDVNIGVWDGGFAGPHIDFMSRTTQVQPTNLGNVFGSHATHVVGNMAGAGTRDPAMRGVATEASIFVYDITNAPPFERYIPFEMFQAIENHQIVITQNSYGSDPNASGTCGTGVPYTVFNRSIDHLAYFYPYLTHHFAVGNSRTNCASAAPANGGYRSTVLNAAKNALNVGALERDNVSILAWSGIASSWGPSRDGRILPHVVALGRAVDAPHPYSSYEGTNSWTGTSHSCPTVSGVSALLVQRYKQLHTNTNPPSSLVRAVICNGATDLGNPYPDYQFGFGRLNALKSVKILNEGNYLIDNVSNGNTKTYTAKINVPANTQRLKVMLSWTDPAAMPNALPALINNLNLQVQHDASFTSFNPWILNPATPAAVATRGIDNLNNLEQVTIDNPSAGTYTIQVTGANVNFPLGGTQEFALVWSLEPEYIEVTYPAGGEKLKPNTNEVIQWDAEGITGGNYTIEFYNGSAWSTVANVNITNNQLLRYTWTTPAIITDQAKIRISGMTISGGSTSDESDLPFTIMGVPVGLSSVVITGTAQNNQIKLDWQPVAGADFYDIYRIRQFDNFSAEGNWQLVGSVAAPITTFNSTGLVNGGGYFHTLRARTNTGVISERAYATGLIFPSGIGANLDIRPLSILSPNANICQTNNTVSVRLRNSGLSAIPSGTSIPISFQINAEPPITENLVLATDLGVNEDIDYTFTSSANLTLIGTNTLSITSNLPADGVRTNDKISINLLRNVDNMPLSIIINPSNNFCNSATLTAQNFPVDTYALSNIALATEDMTSATLVNLGDDDFKQFSIGFNFTFFGKTYSEFYINSNGLIGFDGFDHDFAPSVKRLIPNTLTPNNFIAFAWSDLDPSAAGTVKYQVLGTAPNRKLVVEFLNIPYYSSTPPSPNRVNAQIMLYESSNVIEIHSINTQISTFASMIMGLENSGGTKGVVIAGRNDSYWSAVNEGLRFVPSNTSLTWFPNGETTPSISTSLSGNIGFSITQNTCTYSSSINISNTCDITPLDIVSLLPTDNSTSTPLNTNLSITFNKQIKSGTGNITIVGGASPIVIPIGGGATGTVTFSGNTLTINPTMDLEGNVAYHVLIDAGAVTDFATPANIFAGISDANTWNFNTVNHAPILDNTGVFSLSMIDEDVINPIGNTVSEIIASAGGDRITDTDINALEGIAVVSADGSNGNWQYSLDNGSNWVDFGSPATSLALLLPSNAKIRFLPLPNFYGIVSFYFRAWDRTTGVAGDFANISLPANYGGSTAFSNTLGSATIQVNARPTITAIPTQSTNEDLPSMPINFTIGDPDNPINDLDLTISSSNTLLVPNTNIMLSGMGANRSLVLTPANNQFGNTVISITLSDGRISNTITFIFTVNPINDAPIITSFVKNLSNIFSLNFTAIDFTNAYADIENESLSKIKITSLPSNGSLTFNNLPVVINQEIPLASLALLQYTPLITFVGTETLNWQASDGFAYSNTAQIAINVTSGNVAPIISDFVKIGIKNNPISFEISDFTNAYSDIDNNNLVKIKIIQLPSHGNLYLENVLIVLNQEINRLDLVKIVYQPAFDYVGEDEFSWNAFDGYVYATVPAKAKMTLLLGNQAPIVYDFSKNVNENSVLTFTIADFANAFSDADTNDLEKIKIISLPTKGVLLFDNTPVNVEQEINKNALLRLTYRPNANFVGNDNFSWNAFDGVEYANVNASVIINVIYINKPPFVSNISQQGKENQQISIRPVAFFNAFADIENEELTKIQITNLPQKGILFWNKMPVNTNQEILRQDLDLLYYVPQKDYFGRDEFLWNAADAIQYALQPAKVIFSIQPIIPSIPAELKAQAGSERVWLSWQANPETNIAYYEIYIFSINEPLRLVGTTSDTHFTISNLKNAVTYSFRIRAVTRSGIASELSPTVQARPSIVLSQNTNQAGNTSKIYPNPTSKEVIIEVELTMPESVSFILTDLLGRKLVEFSSPYPQTQVYQLFDLEKFPKGVYLIQIQTGSYRAVGKIVKE